MDNENLVQIGTLSPGSIVSNKSRDAEVRILRKDGSKRVFIIGVSYSARACSIPAETEVYLLSEVENSNPVSIGSVIRSIMGDNKVSQNLSDWYFKSDKEEVEESQDPERVESLPKGFDWKTEDVASFYKVGPEVISRLASNGLLPESVKFKKRRYFRSGDFFNFDLLTVYTPRSNNKLGGFDLVDIDGFDLSDLEVVDIDGDFTTNLDVVDIDYDCFPDLELQSLD